MHTVPPYRRISFAHTIEHKHGHDSLWPVKSEPRWHVPPLGRSFKSQYMLCSTFFSFNQKARNTSDGGCSIWFEFLNKFYVEDRYGPPEMDINFHCSKPLQFYSHVLAEQKPNLPLYLWTLYTFVTNTVRSHIDRVLPRKSHFGFVRSQSYRIF